MNPIDKMLEDRSKKHGDFSDHARISQSLKEVMHREIGVCKTELAATQMEGLEMIQHKIARIIAGDPNLPEHWEDIEGYARITRERLWRNKVVST